MEQFGIDIPAGGTVLQLRTVVVAIVVGTLVTVGVGRVPGAARVAQSRRSPRCATSQSAASRRRAAGSLAGADSWSAASARWSIGLAGSGVAVGRPRRAGRLHRRVRARAAHRPTRARATGAPLPACRGSPARWPGENALRNPKRTARTGGALMVGVALVAAITVMSASLKDWIRDTFEEQFTGDFVVATNTFGFGGISPELAAELNELPEVAAATGVRVGVARVGGDGARATRSTCRSTPPPPAPLFDIGMIEGSIGDLTRRRRPGRRRRGRTARPRRGRHARLPVPQRNAAAR